MIEVRRYEQIYGAPNKWMYVGEFDAEPAHTLAGLPPGTYMVHEGSQTTVDFDAEEEYEVPTMWRFLGVWDTKTPDGVPDEADYQPWMQMKVRKRPQRRSKSESKDSASAAQRATRSRTGHAPDPSDDQA